MSKETFGLFSPFSSSPLSPGFLNSPYNWLNFDKPAGVSSPQIGIECLSPQADDIIERNVQKGNDRNEWRGINSPYSNNYQTEANQVSSHLMSVFSSPMNQGIMISQESEDDYEYQYLNFALPPPANSEYEEFLEGMGGMDDLDSDIAEFNKSLDQQYEFSNPTNFVKNNSHQSYNFESSNSLATPNPAANRNFSKSPLSFNILSIPPSAPSSNHFLSSPSPVATSSPPSPTQSPSLNSSPLLSGNQFIEHPIGEHPSRTLFVRNINSNVDEADLRALFEAYGALRSMYTQCKHRGFVMISYYDIRHSKNAMRNLQGKLLRRRKLDIHYSIPKDNPSEKDQNQGTLVVFNLDPSISTDELRSIFGGFGEIKEIRETPNKKHHKFIEFYDVRDAEKAMKQLNKTEIKYKKIKIEPSRPGGRKSVLIQPATGQTPVSSPSNGSASSNQKFSSPNLAPTPCSSFVDSDIDFYLSSNQNAVSSTGATSPLPSPRNSFEYSLLNDSNGNFHPNQMRIPHSILDFHSIENAEDLSNLSKSAPLHSNQLNNQGNFIPVESKNYQKQRSRRSSMKGNLNSKLSSPLPSPDSLFSRPPRSISNPVTQTKDEPSFGMNERKEYSFSGGVEGGANSSFGNGNSIERKKKFDDKSQFVLNIERVRNHQDTRTTLMIKNIPNKYTQKMLLATVDDTQKGFYDFFYLPIDFKNKCNVGYAFINFIDPLSIIPFYEKLHNTKWEKFNSEKVCDIAYARIQGKDCLISHFQNSSLMCEDKKCRPIIFHSNGPNIGQQAPFPVGPNVRVRTKDEKSAFTSPRIEPMVRRQKDDFRTIQQNKKAGTKSPRTRSYSSIK